MMSSSNTPQSTQYTPTNPLILGPEHLSQKGHRLLFEARQDLMPELEESRKRVIDSIAKYRSLGHLSLKEEHKAYEEWEEAWGDLKGVMKAVDSIDQLERYNAYREHFDEPLVTSLEERDRVDKKMFEEAQTSWQLNPVLLAKVHQLAQLSNSSAGEFKPVVIPRSGRLAGDGSGYRGAGFSFKGRFVTPQDELQAITKAASQGSSENKAYVRALLTELSHMPSLSDLYQNGPDAVVRYSKTSEDPMTVSLPPPSRPLRISPSVLRPPLSSKRSSIRSRIPRWGDKSSNESDTGLSIRPSSIRAHKRTKSDTTGLGRNNMLWHRRASIDSHRFEDVTDDPEEGGSSSSAPKGQNTELIVRSLGAMGILSEEPEPVST